jgi:hypothetical protein
VLWTFIYVSGRKPSRKQAPETSTSNDTGRPGRIGARIECRRICLLKYSHPCRRKRDPTQRNTRSRKNLTFGRDLEGELADGIDPGNYEDPSRFTHRLHHHYLHHHQHLHPFTFILVVIPRSHCGFCTSIQLFILYHAYYYDDVNYLHEWVASLSCSWGDWETLATLLYEINMIHSLIFDCMY